MGAWSGEPFGNELATDWAWELEEAEDWLVVRAALDGALTPEDERDEDRAIIALAAAEVVAHALGRPTQDDAYTQVLKTFVERAPSPAPRLVSTALAAVARAGAIDGALGRTWAECGPDAWLESNERLAAALRGQGRRPD
jgi:hypothetical protein